MLGKRRFASQHRFQLLSDFGVLIRFKRFQQNDIVQIFHQRCPSM